MNLLKSDHDTRYEVPGVPGLVRKPVNVDGSAIGFTRLRSLRLYQFEAASVIDGHAEQDEVFVIVTAGAVEMRIGFDDQQVDGFGTFTLSANGISSGADAFVAYLPPHSVYRMTPLTDADVFYARATPSGSRQPAVFRAASSHSADSVRIVFADTTHAERLRVKILSVTPETTSVSLHPVDSSEGECEALVHVQSTRPTKAGRLDISGSEPLQLRSWDTVALGPGEHAVLLVEQGSDVTVLVVSAC